MKLYRMLRRKTSLEQSAETLLETEFLDEDGRADLRLSTYQVQSGDDSRLCQVSAEHAASAHLDPGKVFAIDLCVNSFEICASPTDRRYFAFLDSAHREVILSSASQLKSLAETVSKRGAGQLLETLKPALKEYVRARIGVDCPEWREYFSKSPKGGKWRDFGS